MNVLTDCETSKSSMRRTLFIDNAGDLAEVVDEGIHLRLTSFVIRRSQDR